jgi:hypothetical protein
MALPPLLVKISADTAGFDAGAQKVKAGLSNLGSAAAAASKSIAAWGAGAVAAAAAVGIAMTKAGLDSVDALAKSADAIGITTNALTELQHASEAGGLSADGMTASLTRMTRRIAFATEGAGAAHPALSQMALDLDELAKKSPDEQLAILADEIGKIDNQADKAAAAFQIFGNEGTAMLNVIQDGSAGLAEMRQEARDLGLSLDRIDAAKVEAANDAIARATSTFGTISRDLAVEFAPILAELADRFTAMAKETGIFGRVAETVFTGVQMAAEIVGDAIRAIEIVIRGVQAAFQRMGAAFLNIAATIQEGFDSIFNGVIAGANATVSALNNIPGVDLSPIEFQMGALSDSMREMQAQLMDDFTDTRETIVDLISEPWPSEGIAQFFDDARAAADEAAQEFVDRQLEQRDQVSEIQKSMTAEQLEQLQEQISNIGDRFRAEQDLLQEHLSQELQIAQEAFEQGLIDEEERNELFRNLAEEHQEQLNEIEQRAADERIAIAEAERQARINIYSSLFDGFAQLTRTGSKKAFEVGKAAALTSASLKGMEAAQSAWAAGMAVGGPFAPLTAAAYTASSLAHTGAQIAQISAMQFGQKQRPITPSGDTPAADTGGGGGGGGQTVVIDFVGGGEGMFSRDQVVGLIGQINDAVSDGATLKT